MLAKPELPLNLADLNYENSPISEDLDTHDRHLVVYMNQKQCTQSYVNLVQQIHRKIDSDFAGSFKNFKKGLTCVIGIHPTSDDGTMYIDPVAYMLLKKDLTKVQWTEPNNGLRRFKQYEVFTCYSFGVLHDFRRQGLFTAMVKYAKSVYGGSINDPGKGSTFSRLRFAIQASYATLSTLDAIRSLGFTQLDEQYVNVRTDEVLNYYAIVDEFKGVS